MYDADVKASHKGERGVYFTHEICFEMDLAKTLLDRGRRRDLDRIINTACGDHARATADMIKKACRKLDINYHDYPARRLWNVNPRNKRPCTSTILPGCTAIRASFSDASSANPLKKTIFRRPLPTLSGLSDN